MRPLSANLKHLYQHHIMWISYLLFIPYIIMALRVALKPDPSFTPIAFILLYTGFWGSAIGSIATDVWNKPFAFVLPGHIKAAQKMLVLTWLFVTLLGTASIAGIFLPEIGKDYAVLTALIGITSLIYWAGVGLSSSHRRYLKNLFSILYLFPFVIMVSSSIRNAASSSLIAHPWILTFVGGLISYLIYRDVTHRDNIRHLCGSPWAGILDGLDKRKQKKLTQARMRMKQGQKPSRIGELAGNFFSERIRDNAQSMFWPHMWGQIYLSFGRLTGYWKWILLNSLFLPIYLCLMARIDESGVIRFDAVMFVMASALGGLMCANLRSESHFLLRSRRFYFNQGIVSMLTSLLIVTGFMGISILFSHTLSGLLAPLVIMGISFDIVTINTVWLAIPVIFIPFIAGLIILLKGRSLILGAILIIMIITLVPFFYHLSEELRNISLISGLIIFLLITLVTWLFHLAILYYDSMKRSLC